jgi:DNA end-binding protein Ku
LLGIAAGFATGEEVNVPRAIWKGSISFGLVSIPIELHTAVRDHRPRFRMLHKTDKSPVQFTRVCAREGRPVAWDDLVKGYEYSKGHFVVLTKEDFQAAAIEKTRRVDIIDFVNAEDIDDRFFDTPYYLVPTKGGEHAYALLREAMRTAGRVGIAKFVLRDALHLAAVEVIGDAIVLTMMRFADELVDPARFPLPKSKDVRKAELEMATALVTHLAAEWDPSKYTDEYRENLMRIIQGKLKGKKVEIEPATEHHEAKVLDLMDRLRQSLARGGAKSATASERRVKATSRSSRKKRTRRAA